MWKFSFVKPSPSVLYCIIFLLLYSLILFNFSLSPFDCLKKTNVHFFLLKILKCLILLSFFLSLFTFHYIYFESQLVQYQPSLLWLHNYVQNCLTKVYQLSLKKSLDDSVGFFYKYILIAFFILLLTLFSCKQAFDLLGKCKFS